MSRSLSGSKVQRGHMEAATARKIRVVVAKPGLDGHDRGAKIIARALRDAGMEVIYTGLHQTPEQIAETVIQEDADAVGLSILSGAHMTLVPRVVELLAEQGVDDVLVTVGGTIPAEDIPELKKLGVAAVFTPGRRHRRDRRFHPRGRRRAPRGPSDGAHVEWHTAACIDRLIDWSVNQPEQPSQGGLNLKICVLVKEVPDAAVQKRIDPNTMRLDRSGEKNLNPFDTHAIEAAMQIKEGGAIPVEEVVAVTMGPDSAVRALHKAVALGADRSVHLSDDALAGSDVCATGYALAKVLESESPDLVLLGQQSDDGECYTIGAVVADHLKMPSLTQVIKIDVTDGKLRCERQAEYGYDTVEVELPAVISVGDAINEPRYPSLKAIMGAKKKQLDAKATGDVGIDGGMVGEAGSKTSVLALNPPPAKEAGEIIEDEDTNETVEKIVAWLDERKLI